MSDRAGGRDDRDLGLDAFRGLTVLLMAFVNLQGGADAAFPLLVHAAWNGLTLADLVFPWFILVVGLSAPLALKANRPPALKDVVRRVAVLFVIGVILGWLIRPTIDLDQVRWVGVLQRIAIVYLVCVVVVRTTSGAWLAGGLSVGCLVVHALAILFVTAPGEPAPSLAMGQGFSAWLDQTVVPGRLDRETWDPEGAWSTLSAIGTGLLGVAAARLTSQRGIAATATVAAVLVVLGIALIPILPLNKALWTASYAMIAVGSGLALWILLRRAAKADGGRRLLATAVFAGQTALTFYVAHMLLIAVLVRTVSGETLWSMGFGAIEHSGLPDPLASLVFALIATVVSMAPVPWLRRHGWLVRA